MLAESTCDTAQRLCGDLEMRAALVEARPWTSAGYQPGSGGRPVLRSDPIRSSRRYQNGAPSTAAPTEISSPRILSGQPHAPSAGLGADQPSGIPIASRKFVASTTHRSSSSGVLQKPWSLTCCTE